MKKYFYVNFRTGDSDIYSVNIAHAQSERDVIAHYSKYPWSQVRKAEDWEVLLAQRKHMPIIEIEPAKNLSDMISKASEQAQQQAPNGMQGPGKSQPSELAQQR